jgi:formiminotetrahydrofolate cyclodeaminase
LTSALVRDQDSRVGQLERENRQFRSQIRSDINSIQSQLDESLKVNVKAAARQKQWSSCIATLLKLANEGTEAEVGHAEMMVEDEIGGVVVEVEVNGVDAEDEAGFETEREEEEENVEKEVKEAEAKDVDDI